MRTAIRVVWMCSPVLVRSLADGKLTAEELADVLRCVSRALLDEGCSGAGSVAVTVRPAEGTHAIA